MKNRRSLNRSLRHYIEMSGTPSFSDKARHTTIRAESDNKIKGGNSNWRRPIWFPTTFLFYEIYHGENGAVLGPRTRTGLVAALIDEWWR